MIKRDVFISFIFRHSIFLFLIMLKLSCIDLVKIFIIKIGKTKINRKFLVIELEFEKNIKKFSFIY